ncbi:adrenodoxin-like isoform X1 [Crassostrea angulata]|uniref:adrenodoxin-like isoform X1 n=1 Tax=Magallana angulata TaxID=2784310 RepID=UPI00148AA8EA|nr:adrenodoxin isoform X1 [Crassostrea gigas]XP_052711877.1 adrenodoxin-like isoform X1 [Crassostrea angulata]
MAARNVTRYVLPRFASVFQRFNATTAPLIMKRRALYRPEHSRLFTTSPKSLEKETVMVHFIMPDGSKQTAKTKVGENLLDIIVDNDIDIDGFGACEGTLACSTCHLIFSKEDYEKIKDKPTDEELDMLDLAYGLTDTSRLGCQVIVTKEMDGLVVKVPSGVADARNPS